MPQISTCISMFWIYVFIKFRVALSTKCSKLPWKSHAYHLQCNRLTGDFYYMNMANNLYKNTYDTFINIRTWKYTLIDLYIHCYKYILLMGRSNKRMRHNSWKLRKPLVFMTENESTTGSQWYRYFLRVKVVEVVKYSHIPMSLITLQIDFVMYKPIHFINDFSNI